MNNTEDLGIRLRADGVLETTSGIELTGKAVEELGKQADASSKRLEQMDGSARKTTAGAQVLNVATQQVVGQMTQALPLPGAVGGPEVLSVGGRDYLMMGSRGGNVVPNDQALQPAGGGGKPTVLNYSPTFHIDARTDRAEVYDLVVKAAQQSQADLLEKMSRNQV